MEKAKQEYGYMSIIRVLNKHATNGKDFTVKKIAREAKAGPSYVHVLMSQARRNGVTFASRKTKGNRTIFSLKEKIYPDDFSPVVQHGLKKSPVARKPVVHKTEVHTNKDIVIAINRLGDRMETLAVMVDRIHAVFFGQTPNNPAQSGEERKEA